MTQPGWDAVRDFFLGPAPTISSALAAAELTVAVAGILLLAWPVAWLVGRAVRRAPRLRLRTVAGTAVLAGGLLVLAAGIDHHLAATTVALHGGSLREASEQLAP